MRLGEFHNTTHTTPSETNPQDRETPAQADISHDTGTSSRPDKRTPRITKPVVLLLITIFILIGIITGSFITPDILIFRRADHQPSGKINHTEPMPETKTRSITPSPIPSEDPTQALKQQIETLLGPEKENYGIFIKDLENGTTLGINETHILPPASIYKVALAMSILKYVDKGTTTLTQNYPVYERDFAYSFDPIGQVIIKEKEKIKEAHKKDHPAAEMPVPGSEEEISTPPPTDEELPEVVLYYPLDYLLRYLIKFSDNTAMTALERRFGGVKTLQKQYLEEMNITSFTRLPMEATATDIGRVFELLYTQQYLSEKTTEYLLSLLKSVTPAHNDRIVAGLPEGILAAHKIGTLTETYADAGIVYGDNYDFVIVILNKNIKRDKARKTIQRISEMAYEFHNGEKSKE